MMSSDLHWKNIQMLRLLMEQKVEKAMAKRARKKRDKSQPGRIQVALCNKLQAAGIPIPNAECFWIQQGGYRHHHWDLAKWGADFRDEQGRFWCIHSWSTMTECVRYGFDIDLSQDTQDFAIESKCPAKSKE